MAFHPFLTEDIALASKKENHDECYILRVWPVRVEIQGIIFSTGPKVPGIVVDGYLWVAVALIFGLRVVIEERSWWWNSHEILGSLCNLVYQWLSKSNYIIIICNQDLYVSMCCAHIPEIWV